MNLPTNSQFGQYRIVRLLGRGGMGEVYEGEHTTLGRSYALKLLPPEFASHPDALARFRREAQVMAKLEHPHIVRVDDFGETAGRYWLRMELVKGVESKPESGKQKIEIKKERCITLGDYAAQRGGQIEPAEFAVILKQMLEALAFAHDAGVVHRDLKPGNILLDRDAQGRLLVKISDFGLARVVGDEFLRSQIQLSVSRSLSFGGEKTLGRELSVGEQGTLQPGEGASSRALVGTWEYMAPEQRRGETADARSDVYAVGLMCYRLLTGKGLGLKLPSELVSGLAPEWDLFITRALEQDPAARYASGREMLAEAGPVFRTMQGVVERREQEVKGQQAEAERRLAAEQQRRAAEEQLRAAAELARVQAEEEQRQRVSRETARREELEQLKAAQQRLAEERRAEIAQQWAKFRALPVWVWAVIVGALLAGGVGWYWGVPAFRNWSAARVEQARLAKVAQAQKEQQQRLQAEQEAGRVQNAKEAAARNAEAEAQQAGKAYPQAKPFVNSLGMKFVSVPGTEVLFCIWETRMQDYRVFAAAASVADHTWERPNFSPYSKQEVALSPDCPVVNVSWDEAKAFCDWLSRKERAEGKINAQQGYRLPMDWEWSVAEGLKESRWEKPENRRTKSPGVYPWGTEWPPPIGAGNFSDGALKQAQSWITAIPGYEDGHVVIAPVGSYAANGYGIFDLAGNVREWCEDEYRVTAESVLSGYRVVRGSSWQSFLADCLLSSFSAPSLHEQRSMEGGFRVVLASLTPSELEQEDSRVAREALGLKAEQQQATMAYPKTNPFVNSVGMKFVSVPGTEVLFGTHETRAVEFREFALRLSASPERVSQEFDPLPPEAYRVSNWQDAQIFCAWLTKKERVSGAITSNQSYRLPTDLEWRSALGMNGSSLATLDPVRYGITHLGGRVKEWSEDWYEAEQKHRAAWGGLLWSDRVGYPPEFQDPGLAFRCVLVTLTPAQIEQQSREAASKEELRQKTEAEAAAAKSNAEQQQARMAHPRTNPFINSLGMKFVSVPGTEVLFSIWDVRVRDYATYAATNSATDKSWQRSPLTNDAANPVVNVSWEDAQTFGRWLTRQERSALKIASDQTYRLPTDAEWSQAVGLCNESPGLPKDKDGKITGIYPWGTEWPPPRGAGNYAPSLKADDYPSQSPVGSFAPNHLGLYDLGGNVWQWCEDWCDTDKRFRVSRGGGHGSFINDPDSLLSSHRNRFLPEMRNDLLGFRLVLTTGNGK